MPLNLKIKTTLQLLPDSAGVYLMKNSDDKVIYIGKAKNLKNRVRSYFMANLADLKTRELVSKICDIDYILTTTEEQALVLEANLIKKYRPRYNISLKDDKQFPFIMITTNEDFPQIKITRRVQKDGSRYFGPYTDSRSLRRTLRTMEWLFPLRTCSRQIREGESRFKRPCINFQLGKCKAPCIGEISKEDYLKIIRNAVSFLHGRNQEVIDEMMIEMKEYSRDLQFEKAALVRDKIQSIQKMNSSRNLFFTDQRNRDVIGLYLEDNKAAVALLKVLSGKLLNKEIYDMDNVENKTAEEIMSAFLEQYYADKLDRLPDDILLEVEPLEFDLFNRWLNNKLTIPQKGDRKAIISVARDNAFNRVEELKLKYLRKSSRTIYPIKELKDKLGLKRLPRKMICLDISTILGSDTVASLVFFENGKPKKKNYRHFIIKTVSGQDDFASIAEVMTRYLARIDEQEKPDLIVIDGGKGQLHAAHSVLTESGLTDMQMISLAKRMEEIFMPYQSESIILPRNSSALRMLIKLRDEAHRFAISFHRTKRTKRSLQSSLDQITGIGDKTKFLLLKEFGSVENLAQASIEEMIQIKGIGEKTAQLILDFLKKQESHDI